MFLSELGAGFIGVCVVIVSHNLHTLSLCVVPIKFFTKWNYWIIFGNKKYMGDLLFKSLQIDRFIFINRMPFPEYIFNCRHLCRFLFESQLIHATITAGGI